MNPQQNSAQILAWEWTETGYSFQYASNGDIIVEVDENLSSVAVKAENCLAGQVKIPLSELGALKRLIQKVEAIKSGKILLAPTVFIAS